MSLVSNGPRYVEVGELILLSGGKRHPSITLPTTRVQCTENRELAVTNRTKI